MVSAQEHLLQEHELLSLDFITQVKNRGGHAGTYIPSSKQGRDKGVARDGWLPA